MRKKLFLFFYYKKIDDVYSLNLMMAVILDVHLYHLCVSGKINKIAHCETCTLPSYAQNKRRWQNEAGL